MGFLNGRVSFERFKVEGNAPATFDETQLSILEQFAIGNQGALTADGTEVGYAGGDHILDLSFDLEKNIVNDALHASMRVDTNKPPGDLVKAYMKMELRALSADNPSGYPTKQQRVEAKEAAEQRVHAESQDGRFRRTKVVPFLWDSRQNIVYFGASNLTAIDRFVSLFKESFGLPLSRVTTGTLSWDEAQKRGQARALEDLEPSHFAGPTKKMSVAWVANQYGSRDFLGNEFILWLWWVLEVESDTIRLPDDSTVTCMLNKTLTLECPFAETGKETISSEAPTRLPEAKRAVLAGKWPRKSGIILNRHDEQYELALNAEALSVSSASLPKLDGDSGRQQDEDRIDQLRHLTETVDLLFDTFCRRRLSNHWKDDIKKIRLWVEKDE